LQLSYTLARLLDNSESISNNGGNGFGSSADLIPTIEYGNGNLDVRHRVTATFNYALPVGEGRHGFAALVEKGWQVNGLVVLNTGQFINPNASLSLTPCTTSCNGYPVTGFTPVSTFGTITATANAYNPRIIQFAARLKF